MTNPATQTIEARAQVIADMIARDVRLWCGADAELEARLLRLIQGEIADLKWASQQLREEDKP
jgi:hypothetical protein